MALFADRLLNRARCADHLLEDWKTESTLTRPLDAELVSECIDLAAMCRHSWQCLWQLLRADPNSQEVENVGRVIKPAMARTQTLFKEIEELVARASAKGHVTPRAAELIRELQGDPAPTH